LSSAASKVLTNDLDDQKMSSVLYPTMTTFSEIAA